MGLNLKIYMDMKNISAINYTINNQKSVLQVGIVKNAETRV